MFIIIIIIIIIVIIIKEKILICRHSFGDRKHLQIFRGSLRKSSAIFVYFRKCSGNHRRFKWHLDNAANIENYTKESRNHYFRERTP